MLKAKTNSASRAEVIKNAIFYYDFFVDQISSGNEFIVRSNDGNDTRVVMPNIRTRKK